MDPHIAAHERQWPSINPSPVLGATIDACLARGRDVGQAGPIYNSVGCVGAELANAADSLLALKRAVYDEGRYTMSEVLGAIERDFEGDEAMRQYLLNRVPKWGNGDPEADAIARRIVDWYCARVHSFTNARGGACQAALFTLVQQFRFGTLTGAMPDGRRAGEALAPGVGAMPGRDRQGATGLIDSVTKLDFTETPNGAVLDVMLHPTAVRGDAGLDALVNLIKTFFARGGTASLTAYLMQNMLFTLIFYGFALGLYAKLGAASVIGIAVLVALVSIAFTSLWRTVFKRGPLEYVLRGFTYLGTR